MFLIYSSSLSLITALQFASTSLLVVNISGTGIVPLQIDDVAVLNGRLIVRNDGEGIEIVVRHISLGLALISSFM